MSVIAKTVAFVVAPVALVGIGCTSMLSLAVDMEQSSAATCNSIPQSFDNATYSISPSSALRFKGEQLVIASKIYAYGRNHGFKQWEIIGMLQTAIQESDVRNLHYGDGTSVGVFQHIEKYYGSVARRMNVDWAIQDRYEQLAKNKNRENMEPFEVFLKMQGADRAAYENPNHNWRQWESDAKALYVNAQANDTQDESSPVISAPVSTAAEYCTSGIETVEVAMAAAQGQVGKKLATQAGSDGSGLVTWAYKQAGIVVEPDPQNGVSVDFRQDLERGDVLYYGSSVSAINNVALYVNDSTVIEVGSNSKVRESELNFDNYVGASRPVPMPLSAIRVDQVAGGPVIGGWTAPVAGSYNLGSRYGEPRTRPPGYHDGLDLNGMPEGRPILAVAAGTVIDMKELDYSYGWHVKLRHGDGSIVTVYAHMSSFADGLAIGHTVVAGQVIGHIGSTGNSTGNHLHFVVIVGGKDVDPLPFMRNHGIVLGG